jgi:two-component system LytT family response regulator
MTASRIRVLVADDERPARAFLSGLLRHLTDVTIVAEASNGAEAIQLIEKHRPDVALLDLQMPEVDGMTVVRLVKRQHLPLVVFVTAYDEFAVKAFEMNAVDYLTKPVTEARLRETFRRVRQRLERPGPRAGSLSQLRAAINAYDELGAASRLERIPIRKREDIVLIPISQVASIVAEGELLHVTTASQERHTMTYRLKDLEARLDPARFIRLGRGTVANIDHIVRVTPLPGGMYSVRLKNGQELDVSRIQSRILRGRLLQL